MGRFIQGEDRTQQNLFPGCLDDHIGEDNPARVVDAYVDRVDLRNFDSARPADTGRPGYHPSTLLKIYLYGYLNRIQSSRRLEREAQVLLQVGPVGSLPLAWGDETPGARRWPLRWRSAIR